LKLLRDAIRRKRPGQLARGVLLHHGSARPHTARATQEGIQELQWELLEHPPYSPDLTSSDFHLFGPLKSHVGGKRFGDDEEVETEVRKWPRQQSLTSILRVSTLWQSGGTSVPKLVEDMSRNKCFFQVRILHVLRLIPICDLFTYYYYSS
jgi:hypothetical protein